MPHPVRGLWLTFILAAVLGGEEAGLRPRVAGACDELVAIPTVGRVGSLNVSAAAAVLLFAVAEAHS